MRGLGLVALLALLPAIAYAPALLEGRLLGPGDGGAPLAGIRDCSSSAKKPGSTSSRSYKMDEASGFGNRIGTIAGVNKIDRGKVDQRRDLQGHYTRPSGQTHCCDG